MICKGRLTEGYMRKNTKHYYLIFYVILLSFLAQSVSAAFYKYRKDERNVYISIGQTNIKANELVYGQPSSYPVDYKLSQLIWESRNVPMLYTGINVRISPSYTFNLEGKFAVKKHKSIMDDYDWSYVGRDWSDQSNHPDTTLTEASGYNLNFDFDLLGKKRNKLSMLVGYKEDRWSWESRGGTYIYSTNSTTGYRSSIGSFTSGQKVISYSQHMSTPYIGLRFESKLNKWKFNFQYEYSDWVKIKAVDDHYLRDLLFEDTFSESSMNAYKLGVSYQISKKFNLHLNYAVQKYDEARGNTVYKNDDTGVVIGGCTNCAGADNSSASWSFGTIYAY